MKKLLILIFAISLFLPTTAIVAEDEFVDHFIPKFTPNNKEYKVLDKCEFNDNDNLQKGVQWVYNDDWNTDTIALAYGQEDNQYFIQGTGGTFSLIWKGNIQLDNSIKDGSGIILYFDTRSIDTTASKVETGLRFYFSKVSNPGLFANGIYDGTDANQTIAFYTLVDNCFRFNEDTNTWQEAKVNGNYLSLPKNDASYIYIPYSSLGRFGNSSALLSDETSFIYMSALKITTKSLGDNDSQGRLYIDDLSFVKELNRVCEHDFIQSSVEANRLHSGYTIERCDKCGHVKVISRTNRDTSEPNDNYYTYTFHYGLNQENTSTVKVSKGEACLNVPWMSEIHNDDDTYTFIGWSSIPKHLDPLNPKTTIANENKDFYAFYVLSSFELDTSYSRYPGFVSVISFSGGIYNTLKEKVVFIGNSNNSLYHGMEKTMALELPTVNNSLGGGYSYSYLQFYEAQIVAFKPKIVVIPLTSNDFAYFNMSINDIMEITAKLCDNIHDALPDTVICIMHSNVLPGRVSQTRAIEKLNARAKKYCDQYDYMEYIDEYEIVSEILDKYDPDDLTYWDFWTHMSQSSYDKWYALIKKDLLEIKRKHNIVFD